MSKAVLVIKDENFSTKDAAALEGVLSKKFGYTGVESKPTRTNDDVWEFTATGRTDKTLNVERTLRSLTQSSASRAPSRTFKKTGSFSAGALKR